ncbi:peptidase M20/M25/M40 family protein [Mycobacterium kansasii 824]|nr:peptidase M20/M25/M40 family protein [Mycobacterium kansasii 824]
MADLLSQAGFDDVWTVSEGGAPAVIARYPAPPGAPTVLLYAHHDVQPEGDRDQWASPPFEPTERDGRLYGRGTADDKAGIATHLAAFRAHGGRPPVGVTVFVEGEEESGSPSLGRLLAAHRDMLAADVIVIADSDNWSTDVPALTVSLRGLADCVVEVATLDHGLHSGLWGGVVPDALSVLVRLLASLHDDDGNVAVAGLHETDVAALNFPDYPPERVRAGAGLLDGVSEIGSGTVPQRLWAKPAITVIGIDTTSVAAASNTLIPRARAKISLRVAPGVTPSRIWTPWRPICGGTHRGARGSAFTGARSASRTPSRPAVRSTTPHARRSGGPGAPIPSTWAWAGRFRSSPSSHGRFRRRKSWSPASRIPQLKHTASTRACIWGYWSAPRSPKRCCWLTWPDQTGTSGRRVAMCPVALTLYWARYGWASHTSSCTGC